MTQAYRVRDMMCVLHKQHEVLHRPLQTGSPCSVHCRGRMGIEAEAKQLRAALTGHLVLSTIAEAKGLYVSVSVDLAL